MAKSPLNVIIQHLMADLGTDGGGMTDGELLARFVSSRDVDALAALVRRHAPMVWGVCCRLLPNHHDAEDVFQATFLVLVRRAVDVPRQAVANWLYGVARKTAVRLRATTAKRGRRETQVVNMPEPTVAVVRDADLQSVLDEELVRLPDHYRGVIVLCDVEGLTRKEAARQLGIPEGSVASRLARGRVMLAKRLTQRGVVFSGGSVSAVLSARSALASTPPTLVASTIKAASLFAAGNASATCVISAKVAALTEGMMKSMFVTKIKNALAVVLVFAALAGAAGLIYQTQARAKEEKPAAKKEGEKGEEQQVVKEVKLRVLTNPAKDFTVVSDRDEKFTDFFKRQLLVVGMVTAKEATDQFEAKEPGPKLFVNYASYNHGPNGRGHTTFGAYVRIAPIPKRIAAALADGVKDGKRVMVVFRRDAGDLPNPEKVPPVWHVVGYTTRDDVRLFESSKKIPPDDFSPQDLWYAEAKKDSPEK